jgi:hypothetical protein
LISFSKSILFKTNIQGILESSFKETLQSMSFFHLVAESSKFSKLVQSTTKIAAKAPL